MPRYIDADDFFDTFPELDTVPYNTFPASKVVEVEQISLEISRLRTNRAYGLTGFYCNEGKDYHVIVSKKDRGYWEALDDIEGALLGKEKTDGASS